MTEENQRTADQIIETIRELQAANRCVTRHTVADKTGLPKSTVDDRMKYLVDVGRLYRPERGVYELAPEYPPTRPVYHAMLPGGLHKVEIGDEVLTLNPHEARMLGHMLAGASMAYISGEMHTYSMERVEELTQKVSSLGRTVREARAEKRKDKEQPE